MLPKGHHLVRLLWVHGPWGICPRTDTLETAQVTTLRVPFQTSYPFDVQTHVTVKVLTAFDSHVGTSRHTCDSDHPPRRRTVPEPQPWVRPDSRHRDPRH